MSTLFKMSSQTPNNKDKNLNNNYGKTNAKNSNLDENFESERMQRRKDSMSTASIAVRVRNFCFSL